MAASIVESILAHGNRIPDKEAIADGTQALTYGRLSDKIRGAAFYLKGQGISPGDKIGIVAETSAAYVIGYFAIHLAGGQSLLTGFRPRLQ